MDTMDMIYVDLNSIIHANLELLATWEGKCGSQSTARRYQEKADKLKDAIEEVEKPNNAIFANSTEYNKQILLIRENLLHKQTYTTKMLAGTLEHELPMKNIMRMK